MGRTISSGFRGAPHAHLTGRPAPSPDRLQQPVRTPIKVAGPPVNGAPLWGELHRWALATEGSEDARWMVLFRLRVPCGECRKHWDGMCVETPPTWGDLFAWTVARHNEVNRRLRKPEMTVEEAREKWSATP